MAKAKVGAGGIEYIQGALKKPKKSEGHRHGNYVIMTHRSAPTTNPDCQRVYVKDSDAYTRSTPVTPKEIQIRSKFANIASMVAERAADLSYITQDQIDFLAQKDQPGGKKTMKAYLWKICKQAYESGNNG